MMAPGIATDDRAGPSEGGERSPADDQIVPTDDATRGTAGTSSQVGFATYVSQVGLLMIAALALSLAFFLIVVSGLEHQAAQTRQLDRFRSALAAGTAPTGQTDQSGKHLLALGTPVALIQIPSIHVHEVIGEGTTPQVLIDGPGHRRDTPLPGQPGVSVVMGRQAAYGGPFKRLDHLRPGDKIIVTVGFGNNVETFRVIDVRQAGDPRPAVLAPGRSRLTLITASGTPFLPHGLLYVDADLVSAVQPASAEVLTSPSQLMSSEAANANDNSTVWALVLWLQALLLITIGAVWAWHRWGRQQTWIVFLPLTILVGYEISNQLTRLLPNVL
jgi:sortase A